MSHQAKAYAEPNNRIGDTPYSFCVQCPGCPEWPWPQDWEDPDHEAFVVHTCYDTQYPDGAPCPFFAYMEGADTHVVVHCLSQKWEKEP